MDVNLVLFDEVLDNALKIDRIFKQSQGHVLLIGVSGSGKTTLSKFVAWMNGLAIFQIKVHKKYSSNDFDDDLRKALKQSGCKGEKVAFIMDESNILDSSFLERINTLLANGEVPGLFENESYTALISQCKEAAQKQGLMLDTSEELYRWFTNQVMKNLHVIFTMNPSNSTLKNRVSTSPALFNRCVINWFGDWREEAYHQVGDELTYKIDFQTNDYTPPNSIPLLSNRLQVKGRSNGISFRDSIVNSFVFVHQTLNKVNEALKKSGEMRQYPTVTPRHFLDFINQYVKLYNAKKADLEDQQLHLNVGLRKIQDTVDQVEELQKSLALKRIELENKNELANLKLKDMLTDKQEAERNKKESQEFQLELIQQEKVIDVKKKEAMIELSEVEPAVFEAQQAVKSISKQNLVEVRVMSNPPTLVKIALESICFLLGENYADWKAIRSVIVKDSFISTILNFSTDSISENVKNKFLAQYLSNPDYSFEKVNRASQACGPLVKWAIAQINYAKILGKVEPLRNEVKSLEKEAKENRIKVETMNENIDKLEESILRYKDEYASLVTEAQVIKNELEVVEIKVERSVSLIHSLSSEKERWEDGCKDFMTQMSTLPGDVLLSAAFVVYAGYFNQKFRNILFDAWCSHLTKSGISFKADISRIEFLSLPDERMRWSENALPTDDVCVENAIMLKYFNRYPLIIDPSGQAIDFLFNEYYNKKIMKTSFLDDAFTKNLESALRFGTPLLVEDVENYDPILNPVLNREVRKTGGRVLITIGDQDIDLSPSFSIFLSTRDPTAIITPDLSSRVTLINFTITRSSLQTQCLNQVLKSERPDVDSKRTDLLKLQGEFKIRLRHLEKSLLQALNDAKGRILDDDSVISKLEVLKKEACEVAIKARETDAVIEEIEVVSTKYAPFSHASSSIYFAIDALHQVHFLYQFSLQAFLSVFESVLLHNPNLHSGMSSEERLSVITSDLFSMTYNTFSQSLFDKDRTTFAFLLARIYLANIAHTEPDYTSEFQQFLKSEKSIDTSTCDLKNIQTQLKNLVLILPQFSHLSSLISHEGEGSSDFWHWSTSHDDTSNNNNTSVDPLKFFPASQSKNACLLSVIILSRMFKPEEVIFYVKEFVKAVFKNEMFLSQTADKNVVDLNAVVCTPVAAATKNRCVPIILCSTSGYDASVRVEDLASELNKSLSSIAIGSAEGFVNAEKSINSASKSGSWVLFKNIHLAPQWLVQLEKKIYSLKAAPGFALFLTMQVNDKVPVNLLRISRFFVIEAPSGLKANLCRTYSSLTSSRINKAPRERAKLYFVLAWLHAIIQERLNYSPFGWSKKYEFNESDLRCACDTLDFWIDLVAKGKDNISPDKIPWKAFSVLFSQCVYGGKIDNAFDQKLMNSYLSKFFNSRCFDDGFCLIKSFEDARSKLMMPDGMRKEHFVNWIEKNLSDKQEPSWLGLPNSTSKVILIKQSQKMCLNLSKISVSLDEANLHDIPFYDVCLGKAEQPIISNLTPDWMIQLKNSLNHCLQDLLPQSLPLLKRNVENLKDPLYRFFEREVNFGSRLLCDVRFGLCAALEVMNATQKSSNFARSLIEDIAKGIIPKNWKGTYVTPPYMTFSSWIVDLGDRFKQLLAISQLSSNFKSCNIWIGGLFSPEAFITATKQFVSQANSWPLESLEKKFVVGDGGDERENETAFCITGMKLQCAECIQDKLYLSTRSMNFNLTSLRMYWQLGGEQDVNAFEERMTGLESQAIVVPVYLNTTRSDLLFTVKMELGDGCNAFDLYERGVGLICSSL